MYFITLRLCLQPKYGSYVLHSARLSMKVSWIRTVIYFAGRYYPSIKTADTLKEHTVILIEQSALRRGIG